MEIPLSADLLSDPGFAVTKISCRRAIKPHSSFVTGVPAKAGAGVNQRYPHSLAGRGQSGGDSAGAGAGHDQIPHSFVMQQIVNPPVSYTHLIAVI